MVDALKKTCSALLTTILTKRLRHPQLQDIMWKGSDDLKKTIKTPINQLCVHTILEKVCFKNNETKSMKLYLNHQKRQTYWDLAANKDEPVAIGTKADIKAK